MQATLSIPRQRDTPLWVAAVGVSVVLNLAFGLLMAFLTLKSDFFKPPPKTSEPPTRSVTIQPVTSEAPEAAETPEGRAASFARTSEDQAGPAPEDAPFIGERDTQARSENAPGDDSPILPSQDGIEPRIDEVETTESDYQDGDLAHRDDGAPGSEPVPESEPTAEATDESDPDAGPPSIAPDDAAPAAPEPAAAEPAAAEPAAAEVSGADDEVAGGHTELAETPFPYERPVMPDAEESEAPRATPETAETPLESTEPTESMAEVEPDEEADERAEEAPADERAEDASEPETVPQPAGGGEPGFRGNQRKTLLKGSISRRGKSSLDVKSGPLGRYHAAISRAIEKAWQRQAVANRDYITPGVIRVRVVLDEEGKVRSVGTVDEFGIGAIQRGFTHRAIREAALPAMPAEVKSELGGDPLELLYNFVF